MSDVLAGKAAVELEVKDTGFQRQLEAAKNKFVGFFTSLESNKKRAKLVGQEIGLAVSNGIAMAMDTANGGSWGKMATDLLSSFGGPLGMLANMLGKVVTNYFDELKKASEEVFTQGALDAAKTAQTKLGQLQAVKRLSTSKKGDDTEEVIQGLKAEYLKLVSDSKLNTKAGASLNDIDIANNAREAIKEASERNGNDKLQTLSMDDLQKAKSTLERDFASLEKRKTDAGGIKDITKRDTEIEGIISQQEFNRFVQQKIDEVLKIKIDLGKRDTLDAKSLSDFKDIGKNAPADLVLAYKKSLTASLATATKEKDSYGIEKYKGFLSSLDSGIKEGSNQRLLEMADDIAKFGSGYSRFFQSTKKLIQDITTHTAGDYAQMINAGDFDKTSGKKNIADTLRQLADMSKEMQSINGMDANFAALNMTKEDFWKKQVDLDVAKAQNGDAENATKSAYLQKLFSQGKISQEIFSRLNPLMANAERTIASGTYGSARSLAYQSSDRDILPTLKEVAKNGKDLVDAIRQGGNVL